MGSETQSSTLTVKVTPSDSTDLPNGEARGFYVGVTGDVAFDQGSNQCILKNAAVGYHLHFCTRIRLTGTAASEILALY